jgi:hypothetical protein
MAQEVDWIGLVAQIQGSDHAGSKRARHLFVNLRALLCSLLISLVCCVATRAQPASKTDIAIAKRLAELAKQAFQSGQTVRAYLLFVEASTRDLDNLTYRDNRDSLEVSAKLLVNARIETVDIAKDIKVVEEEVRNLEPPIVPMEEPGPTVLRSLPYVDAVSIKRDFDLQGDEITLFQQVAEAYGVDALWDPQLASQPNLRFHLEDADWDTAIDALTAATDTFVFPVSGHAIFFARDSEEKRNEFEPVILQTVTLPDAVQDRDLIEVANAVRALLNLRAFGWDSANRTIFILDRVARAQTARYLLQALLVPKAQVALEVQFLTIDGTKTHHYGVSLQTMFQLVNLGHLGTLRQLVPSTATNFLSFDGAGMLLALGITDASLFASFSNSLTTSNYDATVIADDATTVSMHVGEKYPIPTSLFSGASQVAGSIYNPTAQISMEDLGLVLKMTPRVNGEGEIALEVEAEYKTLGSIVLNTVPSVNQRKYTGAITLREGQWAVIAGMDQKSTDSEQNGLAGLSSIPGLEHVFTENTKSTGLSDTLVVIKPTITRLPMSPEVSPQYFLGPTRGVRVLL